MNVDTTPPEETRVHVLTLVPFEVEDRREQTWCSHLNTTFLIDAKERRLRCKACDGEVDPYLAIERIRQGWERWEATRKHCEQKAKAAEQRLAELERDERNCRARLAGLQQKVAADLPADLAEALALLRSRSVYSQQWSARRAALLARHGGGS